MSRVAVVGVGVVGGFFAAQAFRAGNVLTLCVRTRFDELVVETGGQVIRASARVVTKPEEVDVVDFVILATKAHQTPSAAGWMERLCDPQTVVVIAQNGIDQVQRVRPYCPTGTIVPSVCTAVVSSLLPGTWFIASTDTSSSPRATPPGRFVTCSRDPVRRYASRLTLSPTNG